MGVSVLKNATLVLSGINYQSVLTRVELTSNAEMVDETTMGDSTRTRLASLKDWTVTADLHQRWQSGAGVGSSIFSHDLFDYIGGSSFVVNVYPSGTTASISNPKFSGAGILQDFIPVGGGVGEMDATRLTIIAAGDLVKSTS